MESVSAYDLVFPALASRLSGRAPTPASSPANLMSTCSTCRLSSAANRSGASTSGKCPHSSKRSISACGTHWCNEVGSVGAWDGSLPPQIMVQGAAIPSTAGIVSRVNPCTMPARQKQAPPCIASSAVSLKRCFRPVGSAIGYQLLTSFFRNSHAIACPATGMRSGRGMVRSTQACIDARDGVCDSTRPATLSGAILAAFTAYKPLAQLNASVARPMFKRSSTSSMARAPSSNACEYLGAGTEYPKPGISKHTTRSAGDRSSINRA